jgi:SAM-dependent methyltransferase
VEHRTDDYGRQFFEWAGDAAAAAAAVVVPTLLRFFPVHSVVDVGCGTGGWLRAFADHGVTDIAGLDTARVPVDLLMFDRHRFRAVDLTAPPELGRRFDLVVSLEVAEHLPEAAADRFVGFLCSLAPVVLFSAAIPGQEGEAHLNEQWPAYWARRFRSHGFEPIDALRPLLWEDDRVAWFYRQNMLLYVRAADRARLTLDDMAAPMPSSPMALVHPVTFTSYRARAERKLSTPLSLRAHVRALPGAFSRAVWRRVGARGRTSTTNGPPAR